MTTTTTSPPTLYILYGSATGNAEHIAKALAQQALPPTRTRSNGFANTICAPLEKYKKYAETWLQPPSFPLRKHGIVIVTSTTGNGDPPENASRFVRYIKRKSTLETMPFKNCAFAVLGLGDTNYDQFCATGKTIDKKMHELGGARAKSLAMADEATGLEDVVDPWTSTILTDMTEACIDESASEDAKQVPNKAKADAKVLQAEKPSPQELTQKQQPPPPTPSQSETPLCILYGSATGNAEHIAKDLAETYQALLNNPDANCYFPSVVCCELDQYKKKCVSLWETAPPSDTKHGLIVVTSTTGNGDAPENASRFVRYIKRKSTAETMPFRHCAYAVMGLGDTNYDQFCAAGKSIDRKLQELGGTRAKPLAMADEATGLEDVVEPWTQSVLLDITEACRRHSSNPPEDVISSAVGNTPVALLQSKASNNMTTEGTEEEKKIDSGDALANSIGNKNTRSTSVVSPGVAAARSLLSLSPSCTFPTVDHACLPSLGASLSSCELVHDHDASLHAESTRRRSRGLSLAEMEHMTISSSSTTALHYTMARPYQTNILDARYLTATSTEAAKEVIQLLGDSVLDDHLLNQAMQVYQEHFPLSPFSSGKIDPQVLERNGKRVIEMTLGLPDDFTLEYQPGDSLGIVVPNTPQAVHFVLTMLQEKQNVPRTQKISIDSDHPITVEEAVRTRIDLCSPLKSKRILHSLSQFATDPEEECVLRLLASKTSEGEELFRKLIDDQRMSVVDLLEFFPSCQILPLEGLFGALPGIPPRYYSVSSSPLDQRHNAALSLTVTFSVVDYVTPSIVTSDGVEIGLRRKGGLATRYLEVLCSPFLSEQSPSDEKNASCPTTLAIFPKPTKEFQLPSLLSTPIILIGPGTGVAPFMGFLRHRQAQALQSRKAANTVVEGTWRGDYELEENELSGDAAGLLRGTWSSSRLGPAKLFFGCRTSDHDWLYREEMLEMERSHQLELHTAFSRQSPKHYVQDRMREDKEELAEWIVNGKACVYVCGDGNHMARDVQAALVEILSPHVKQDAKEFLEELKKQNRFVMDIWTS